MASSRLACVTLVTLASCAETAPVEIAPFVDSGKADGAAKRLRQLDRTRIELDEPSDLTIVDGVLYTVSDAHSRVYELDLDGETTTVLDIEGRDLEALAFDDARGEFLVAGERSARIWHLRDDGERYDPFDVDADDGNSGIEGLAFDRDGHLYVAKEKDPARIFELDREGNVLRDDKIRFADDLSALAFDPGDGHLYALSDEEHALYRLDENRDVELAWRLPVEHPEGIAFDGDLVYVVSDSEERLYVFERARD
jgi:uncharacterized protein YjiK